MSIYIDNFLLISNIMRTLEFLKQLLAKKYDMKDISEVKTIIRWQITRNSTIGTIKINQSAFIRDLVIEEGFTDCNISIIPMKSGLSIEMLNSNDYKETNLYKYQQLIYKLNLATDPSAELYLILKTYFDPIAFWFDSNLSCT